MNIRFCVRLKSNCSHALRKHSVRPKVKANEDPADIREEPRTLVAVRHCVSTETVAKKGARPNKTFPANNLACGQPKFYSEESRLAAIPYALLRKSALTQASLGTNEALRCFSEVNGAFNVSSATMNERTIACCSASSSANATAFI